MKKELIVGTVFVLAVVLTLFGTVIVSGWNPFERTVTWVVMIKDVRNLEPGDEVRVLGHRMGVVRSIRFDRARYQFRVVCRMDADAPIREGYRISVRDTSALGGKFLHVDPGAPTARAADFRQLVGEPGGDMMSQVSDALRQVKKVVADIGEGRGTLGRLVTGDDIYRDLKATTEALREVAQRLQRGEGTVGRLIGEETFYRELRQLVARLNDPDSALGKLTRKESGALIDDLAAAAAHIRSIAAKADRGEGTLGQLVNNRQLYENLNRAVDTARAVADGVREGRGVVGMLVADEQTRENVHDAIQSVHDVAVSLRSASDDIQRGTGTLGRLVKDDTLYENFNAFAENVKSASAKLRQGPGTLARLLNDPDVYQKAKRLLSRAIDAIENARDSAPVSMVTSFLLGPFQ